MKPVYSQVPVGLDGKFHIRKQEGGKVFYLTSKGLPIQHTPGPDGLTIFMWLLKHNPQGEATVLGDEAWTESKCVYQAARLPVGINRTEGEYNPLVEV